MFRPGAIMLMRSAPKSAFSDGGSEMKTMRPERAMFAVKVPP
jgi:hypothetical protein